jgi:ribosomal protein S18 acetylase RimI-like enzyme
MMRATVEIMSARAKGMSARAMHPRRGIRVGLPPHDGYHALVAFVTAHPACDVDAPLARFILARRVRDHGAIFDVHDGDERIALAALVESSDGGELVLLGARFDRLDRRAVTALIARVEARAARTGAVAMPMLPDRRDWEELLRARHWQEAYRLLTLERAADLVSPRPRPLPRGWRWRALDEARLNEHRRLMLTLFTSVPGAYVPPLEELLESAGSTSILVGEGRELAFAGVRADPVSRMGYINVIGRAPELRGRGVGDHALLRALAMLRLRKAERVELEVVAGNDAALALYQRHHFAVSRMTPVLRRIVAIVA